MVHSLPYYYFSLPHSSIPLLFISTNKIFSLKIAEKVSTINLDISESYKKIGFSLLRSVWPTGKSNRDGTFYAHVYTVDFVAAAHSCIHPWKQDYSLYSTSYIVTLCICLLSFVCLVLILFLSLVVVISHKHMG